MQCLGRGNANICFQIGAKAYRICVRYSSLSANNELTCKNYEFISTKIMRLKKLCKYVCPMDLESINIDENWSKVLIEEGIYIDGEVLFVIVMPVLRDSTNRTVFLDHFNKLHLNGENRVIWEFKPKWLFQSTTYCRNCTHNSYKGRPIRYCFSSEPHIIVKELFTDMELPKNYIQEMEKYLESLDNILFSLYDAQREAKEDLSLLMTLRDVTCFLQWSDHDGVKVSLVDVDLKPIEKLKHWRKTERELGLYAKKTPSHSRFYN